MLIFRPVTEDDLPMLLEWLQRPHVSEWWKSETSLDAVRDEYLAEGTYIAFDSDVPIAYVQSYPAIEKGAIGIDQFIADAKNLGRGLGTELVRQFAAFLFRDPAVRSIQVDPSPDNLRAIRCYEKAGFRRGETITTADGPALLMTLDR
jgi:RimJ/RimL family protein N-acetyltransferase